jgi:hypothetical protein
MKKLPVASVVFLTLLMLTPLSSSATQAANQNWNIQTVAQGIGALSLALNASNTPHIQFGFGYFSWNGSGWSRQNIDPSAYGGNLYGSLFLAFDSKGYPHVCFDTSHGLKYASLIGSEWSVQVVDSYGEFPSLVVDKAGNPRVSYLDGYVLEYAFWNGTGWSTQDVDSAARVGDSSSLALDSKGNPHICYDGGPDGTLRQAYWNGSGWSIQDVAPVRAWSICLKIDQNDKLHLCYTVGGDDSGLKYATFSGSNWSIQTVDETGWDASLALDSLGNPHIAYELDNGAGHKYTKWTGSSWSTYTIDQEGSSSIRGNNFVSLALDSARNPHIAYFTHDGMKYVYAVLNPTIATWWTIAGVIVVSGVIVVVLAVLLLHRKRSVEKSKLPP